MSPYAVPEQFRSRFEYERLRTNISRMRGFAIYIVGLQLVLQFLNIFFPQGVGEGISIPLQVYIFLSLVTLLCGLVYSVLLSLARRDIIKNRGVRIFLVHSLLYLYALLQMAFVTLNVLTHQGINGQLILVMLVGLIPILKPQQSAITILASFCYTLAVMLFTRNIVDKAGLSQWTKFFQSDMRAYFVIANGLMIVISVFIYRLYVSNFSKSMELEMSNRDLEKQVAERTKALEEKTIAAESASEAKSRFLTSMSHEIRTPLNAIIGMAIAARKAATKEKSDEAVSRISSASEHLLGILNDILDMSNIESGAMQINNERFVFNKVLEETVFIARQAGADRGISFNDNIASIAQVSICGDKRRLRQILLNIVGNAVKFTREDGSVNFSVEKKHEDDDHIAFSFSVSDTGIGISAEQQKKLFIPFEQGSAKSMKHGGTGLGLAISQSLVRLMGGEIKCESALGKGSVFSFDLEFEKAPMLNEDQSPVVPDLTGKHILSVEDIEINRMVIKELLSETHAQIDEAVDGLKAVEMFKSSPEGYYDFVLMDLLMPNMNGRDAAREIRHLDRADAATVPIVALSANAYQQDVEEAIASGMDDHMAKPVDFNALMKILDEKIKRQ